MSTTLDATPITVQRVRKTQAITINYDSTGALVQVTAIRLTTVQQAGVDITAPLVSSFTIIAANIPAPILTGLTNLAARFDTVDNVP